MVENLERIKLRCNVASTLRMMGKIVRHSVFRSEMVNRQTLYTIALEVQKARKQKQYFRTHCNETTLEVCLVCTQSTAASTYHIKDLSFDDDFRCIDLAKEVCYEGYCDDFGPMNMSSTIRFIRLLDAEIASFPSAKIVVCADDGPRALTNAVFLLGAYMMIKLDMTPSQVDGRFVWLGKECLESYRDRSRAYQLKL